jgi:hypothetical protein
MNPMNMIKFAIYVSFLAMFLFLSTETFGCSAGLTCPAGTTCITDADCVADSTSSSGTTTSSGGSSGATSSAPTTTGDQLGLTLPDNDIDVLVKPRMGVDTEGGSPNQFLEFHIYKPGDNGSGSGAKGHSANDPKSVSIGDDGLHEDDPDQPFKIVGGSSPLHQIVEAMFGGRAADPSRLRGLRLDFEDAPIPIKPEDFAPENPEDLGDGEEIL